MLPDAIMWVFKVKSLGLGHLIRVSEVGVESPPNMQTSHCNLSAAALMDDNSHVIGNFGLDEIVHHLSI